MSTDELRIGDAERDDALRKLGEHLAAGRLDMEEHDERSSKIISARTQRDIKVLFADLPAPQPSFGDSLPAATGNRSVATGQATTTGSAPTVPKGKGAAIRTFAAGLTPLLWCVSIAVALMTGIGWWAIVVPIAYSVVLGAWAQASGDQRREIRHQRRHGRRHGDWQQGDWHHGGRRYDTRRPEIGEGDSQPE
ncbi:MAG TPA: DUF1707 domain-containing protein [Actinopolymorphaceae bacterium]|nr:DUF1707 domain-containing protein [Actinopolymorphaceae bacterium]